jgi:hypothetical protein
MTRPRHPEVINQIEIKGNPAFSGFGIYERYFALGAKAWGWGITFWVLWFLVTYQFPWMQSAGGRWSAVAVLLGPVMQSIMLWISNNHHNSIMITQDKDHHVRAELVKGNKHRSLGESSAD